MMRLEIVLLLVVAIAASVLWLIAMMPGVYGHLPPRQQVTLYGYRLRVVPVPSGRARSDIGRGGDRAARLLIEDLSRRAPILPATETAQILEFIQVRGELTGRADALRALKAYATSGRATKTDLIEIESALKAIEDDIRLPPELQPR